jgi:hypothetical protein
MQDQDTTPTADERARADWLSKARERVAAEAAAERAKLEHGLVGRTIKSISFTKNHEGIESLSLAFEDGGEVLIETMNWDGTVELEITL